MTGNRTQRDSRRGNSLVEFAAILPLLLAIMLGSVDFGRLFYDGVVVSHSAGAGAFFGAQDTISAGNFALMRYGASADSDEVQGVETVADQQCLCPDGTEITCTNIEVERCPGYGVARAYVRVRASHSFRTFGVYPWMPGETQVSRRAWMRVR